MTIIISFHFCPDYNNESNEMVELVYFHKSIQNRALNCELQNLIPLVKKKAVMCLSMGGLEKLRKILRAPNIELHLTGLSSRASCGPGIFHIDNRLNTIPSIVILWYNSHKLSITKNSLSLYKLLCFKHASCLLIYNNKIL